MDRRAVRMALKEMGVSKTNVQSDVQVRLGPASLSKAAVAESPNSPKRTSFI